MDRLYLNSPHCLQKLEDSTQTEAASISKQGVMCQEILPDDRRHALKMKVSTSSLLCETRTTELQTKGTPKTPHRSRLLM
jgi:hypothetical protein